MSDDLAGTAVDSVAFEVERGKIGEFARATRAGTTTVVSGRAVVRVSAAA